MKIFKITPITTYLKPILFVLVGVVIGIALIFAAINTDKVPSNIASYLTFKPTTMPEVTPLPSPSPMPSERALKVAAWAITDSSEASIKKTKEKRGLDLATTNTELIKILAFEWDADPVRLAEVEAMMDQDKSEASRPIVNVDSPDVNVEAPRNKPQTCITSDVAGSLYTTCR